VKDNYTFKTTTDDNKEAVKLLKEIVFRTLYKSTIVDEKITCKIMTIYTTNGLYH